MSRQVPLDRLRDISRQRTFGKRVPAAPTEEKPETPEERVEWPISH
jgi:hypothetical protein